MNRRIAIATKDGWLITEHFGRCMEYTVVELQEVGYKVIGKRLVTPPCIGYEHKSEGILEVVETLKDCSVIVISQIGLGALLIVKEYGIHVYEYRGYVNNALDNIREQFKKQRRNEVIYE